MPEPQDKSDDQPKRDPRLRAFLRRAGPVIAAERGLTPAARIKLQMIAAEMRLPGELLDDALTELQHDNQQGRHYSRWERGFAKFLAEQLKRLDNRILTYDREQRAIKVAEEKYQLTQPQAREIVAEVAKQLDIRRISASEAERHVETTVKEKVGPSIWIDVESRERLFSLGEEWGLTREHVAAVIDHYIRLNKDRKTSEQRRSSLLVATIGVFFLVALATVLYYGMKFTLDTDKVSSNDPDNQSAGGQNQSNQLTPPAWWDDRMSAAVASAMGRLSNFDKIARPMTSATADTRADAYQQLTSQWLESFDKREERGRLEAVLHYGLVLDPDNSVADRTFDSILQSARPPQGGLPSGSDFYRRGLDIVEFGCEVLDSDPLSESRQQQFRGQLDQLTGTYLATLPGGRETVERYQADYLQRLFDHLLEHAATDPALAQNRFDQLRKLGGERIGKDEQSRWATELLVELLQTSPESWKQFLGLMQLCITPSNRDHLPALLDFLEFSIEPELARELSRRFVREFSLDADSEDPLATAAAMRRLLGLSRVVTGQQTSAIWSRLANDTQESLKPVGNLPPDDSTPQELLDLVFWGTQAARLARVPEQAESIQKALNDGPPSLTGDDSAMGTDPSDGPRPLGRDIERLLERLLSLNDVSIASSTSTIRALSERLVEGNNLEGHPREARALARYLLRYRPVNDQKRLVAVIDPLNAWNDLLLAIADELDQPGTSAEQSSALVSTLLDLDLVLDGTSQGSESLKQKLVERALSQLTGDRTIDLGQPIWLRLQDQLVSAIHQRRDLFASFPAQPPPVLPGEAMVDLVQAIHEWAITKQPSLAEEPAFRDLDEALHADDYQVDTDLQLTVAAQQLALRMLVRWIEVEHPKQQSQANKILNDYLAISSERTEVVNQIFDGEQAWLKTWLLLRE